MAPRPREWRALLGLTALVGVPVAAYLIWDLGQAGTFAFKQRWLLLLLLAVPLAFWLALLRRRQQSAALGYSSTAALERLRRGMVARLHGLPGVLRVLALALLALALARPQTKDRGGRVEVEGIDIMLALDMSQSMEARDLAPNRLEAAKKVIDAFISRRRSDKIGMVVFGREAFTYCPLTLDYSVLRTMLADLRLGLVDGKATAIGNALSLSLSRLRRSDAKSRVVILLTDGENNAGNVMPSKAASYAQAMKVKVFTILMGAKEGTVLGRDFLGRPVRVPQQYNVNPKLLQEIADKTGGRAFRATDSRALEETFETILGELERSARRDVAAVYTDAYRPFAIIALILLLGELLLSLTRWRRFP